MRLKNKITRSWQTMRITTRFSLGVGLLLALIVTVALTGYFSLFFVRDAENAIRTSTDIQRMVLVMDRGMERARHLNAEFFLQYPSIGLGAAHERYAQPSVRQIAAVITTSHDLKNLIERSSVSAALQKRRVDLNLYLSSAERFVDTSIQSVELVTDLAAPVSGLEAQLQYHLKALQAVMTSARLAALFSEMRSYVQDFRISRQRHLMQSAFNTAYHLREKSTQAPDTSTDQKRLIGDLLDRFIATAEKIMDVDVAIKAKFNDFALQAKAVEPISSALIDLASNEVKQARARITRANRIAVGIMAAITLAGLFLAAYIARGLNHAITRRVVRLTDAAGALRTGSLNVFAEEQGRDELTELARTFNIMAGRIRELVNDLELKVAQRTAELAESEAKLHQARKMEAIGVLAGGVAHDFNNILGIILGNAELAIDDIPEGNPAALNLKEIRTGCLRAKDVVRQLLSFSRRSELDKKPVSIAPVIIEALSLMRASISANIEIRQSISDDCGTVIAEPTQIHQLIINLCTNAAHAMTPAGGLLGIEASRIQLPGADGARYPGLKPGPYVRLTVSDTGCGMPPEIKRRIFEPYFTTKEIGKGTGMGLAVVHGIVKNHGGMIAVQSEPGQGSTFNIILPAVEGESPDERPGPQAPPGGSESILLIDDEPALVNSIGAMLQRLGYRVESTTDPVRAGQIFESRPDAFDLVITDMAMPKITGDQLSLKILQLRPAMPIILCSGFSETMGPEQAKALGIRRYLEKPINMGNLARVIREVLE
jgi:signal transduction histidine kinase